MANPLQVREFFDSAFAALGDTGAMRGGQASELTAHFHNTRGQGLANVLAALQAGVTASSRASASSAAVRCRRGRRATSQARTSSRCSHEMGVETGIDLEALIACARRVQEMLGRPLGSHTLLAGAVRW